ncbi:MAG: ATP synthase F1 subunit delta [Gemmatimonadota bacterium]|nr:ATP synthase F1 subunit delta [Gemmatimonadota bacterium]
MHDASIAKNYAEALLELARKADAAAPAGAATAVEEWGGLIHALAGAVEGDVTLRRFLEAPQVAAGDKSRILARGLEGRAPKTFIRFIQKLVTNRRQMLIPDVATAYGDLVDAAAGRVHARLTFARAVGDADRDAIAAQLSKAIGKTIVPHANVNPAILGGVVVRIGDTVMDGSVRRRLDAVRQKMLGR